MGGYAPVECYFYPGLIIVRLFEKTGSLMGWLIVLVCWFSIMPAQADNELLPQPQAIQPDIHFWRRVYTEINTDQGFIHDDKYLNIVYATVQLTPGMERRQRNKKVQAIKKRYRSILLKLARGQHDNLSQAERAVLELWPEDTSRKEFRRAAKRLRFQLGQSDKFKAGLVRSGRWLPYIRDALKRNGVPEELAALPHVESSFNPAAYSFIGAAGMWQFTRSTGRRYMRVDHVVDERLDPFISTEAAAKLLKHNFVTTGAWPLAITAYNHGAAGMRRAVRQTGGHEIVKILRTYKGRRFKFASRNFYVAFIAAADVQQNAAKYFGEFEHEPADNSITVAVPAYIPAKTLAKTFSVDLAVLKKMNPALRPPIWAGEKHVPKNYMLRIPRIAEERASSLMASIGPELRSRRQLPDLTYRVRRGDALSEIADRYRVSVSELMRMNNLRSRHFIRAGQVLRLPKSVVTRAPTINRELVDGTYRVQRGDTLSVIAEAFGVTEDLIVRQNNLSNRNQIHVDQVLIVAASEPQPVVDEPAATAMIAGEIAGGTPVAQAAPEQQISSVSADVAEAEAVDQAEVAGTVALVAAPLSADPSNYSVVNSESISVLAGETLGHYAEWLDLRASDLRRINRLKFGRPLVLGGNLKLDFSRVDQEKFEARRVAYHQNIQEAYFAQYQILGVEERKIRRGDSVWELTHQVYKVPLWLFMQYNPDLNINDVRPGKRVLFPKVTEKPVS